MSLIRDFSVGSRVFCLRRNGFTSPWLSVEVPDLKIPLRTKRALKEMGPIAFYYKSLYGL